MKVQHAGRKVRLHMIPPLELADGFRLYYEGASGDWHRVRLSRRLPGSVFEGTLVEIVDEFRWHRRTLTGGGVLEMSFWLVDSRATYDALVGDNDGE